MTWPVPPAVPISPMMARMMSLAVDARRQRAVDLDAHVLGLGWISVCVASTCSTSEVPMPKRERAEGAMGRGVAVAADDRRAGQGEALLRPDDVHDALAQVEFVVIFDAEFARVLGQFLDLLAALRILDAAAAVGGLDVVVDDGERLVRRAHLAPRHPQALERLRARHLVDEVTVDIDEAEVAVRLQDMLVPDLVIYRTRRGHHRSPAPIRREWRGSRYLCRMGRRGKGNRPGNRPSRLRPDALEAERSSRRFAWTDPIPELSGSCRVDRQGEGFDRGEIEFFDAPSMGSTRRSSRRSCAVARRAPNQSRPTITSVALITA